MKIAAIQLDAVFADVPANLERSEALVHQAVSTGAELVLLPEFFTSAIGFSERMLDVPRQNELVHQVLADWALRYGVIVGGSYIKFDGKDAYNLFQLVFPNGDTYEHKKDMPTQFENCYYTDGDCDHILATPAGNFGVALCWEMIRYDTLRRIGGNADVVLCGSCWWDLPQDAPPEREPLRRYNQELALKTPAVFAELAHTPVAHASHCGVVASLRFPHGDQRQVRQMVGGAQIVDRSGRVLAARPFAQGAGFVLSEIPLHRTTQKQTAVFPCEFWIPDLPDSYLRAWETLNPLGKSYYAAAALPAYQKNSL